MKTKPKKNAFVSFNTVADAIEAFKETYNKLFHSKNLTVKFRKFNGPIGMPGETKQQNPSKAVKNATSELNGSIPKNDTAEQQRSTEEVNNIFQEPVPPCSPKNDSIISSPQFSERRDIKSEPAVNNGDEDIEVDVETVHNVFSVHKPKVKTEVKKVEVKQEPPEDRIPQLKQEPVDEEDGIKNEPRKRESTLEKGSFMNSNSGHIFNVYEKAVMVKEEPMEESGNYSLFFG